MIQAIKKRLYGGVNSIRENKIAFLCIFLAVSVLATPVSGQDKISTSDTFEDENIDGWVGDNIEFSTESVEGNGSIFAEDGINGQENNPEWLGGPNIDLSQDFTVNGTSKITQSSNQRAGFGIVKPAPDSSSFGAKGVILLFSDEYDATFIATNNQENPSNNNLETINGHFNNKWVQWEITSTGNGTVQAKVWEYGTAEPIDYQISRDLEQDSGSLSIFTGVSDGDREVLLDSVSISGTIQTNPRLTIDTRNYLDHGNSSEYTIYFDTETTPNTEVTDNTSLESVNPDIVSVDEPSNTITASSDTSINERTRIRAQYNGTVTYKEITVADSTVENLDVLPFVWRLNGLFGDRAFQIILASTLLAVAMTRLSTSFGGLAIYQMGLTAGWLIGWVPIGLAMVSLFTTLFIGLNMAANIDYTVRR